MRNPIRVGLITDHPIFCAGFTKAIGACANLAVVAEGRTAADALRIAKDAMLDILFLEIEIPGIGIDGVRAICQAKCNTKVIVLTALDDEVLAVDVLGAGAQGYLLKELTGADLIRAIESAHRGELQITPALASRALSHLVKRRATLFSRDLVALTDRERELLSCLSQGLTNREIGLKLGINVKTVKYHAGRLFAKMGVRNRVEATTVLCNASSSMVPGGARLAH